MASDEELIRTLIARCAQLTDDRAHDKVAELFAEDGRFIVGDTDATGRQEISTSLAAISAPDRRSKHLTANSVIEVDGERARGFTDLLFLRATDEGLAPVAAGRYFDTFIKSNGQWFFTERRITFLER